MYTKLLVAFFIQNIFLQNIVCEDGRGDQYKEFQEFFFIVFKNVENKTVKGNDNLDIINKIVEYSKKKRGLFNKDLNLEILGNIKRLILINSISLIIFLTLLKIEKKLRMHRLVYFLLKCKESNIFFGIFFFYFMINNLHLLCEIKNLYNEKIIREKLINQEKRLQWEALKEVYLSKYLK